MIRGAILGLAALAGGAVAARAAPPAPPIAASLPQGGPYPVLATPDGAVDAIGWHAFFVDPRLRRVIATALAENRDLRASIANVAAARGALRVARSAQVPEIDAFPSASDWRGSVGAKGYTGGYGSQTAPSSAAFGVSGGFSSFEIDLWGRVRSLTRAALETWLASDEGRKAAQITLVANVARAWLTIGADADALGVARETLKLRQATLDLARRREAEGVGTALDVAQAQTLVASARSDVASTTTALAQAQNALDLLCGAPVAAADLPGTLDNGNAVLASLPVGLSSAVLLRRPDVAQAEHALAAADANVAAARAARFPVISLTGLLGLGSASLAGLFDHGVFNRGIGGDAAVPLFDGGLRGGNVAIARANRAAALAHYEKAVQAAFGDVADALARRGTIDEQLAAQIDNLAAAEKAASLADARYRTGVDSWLAALDAERTAYAARQSLVATRLERATNMVTLYAVLGGGLVP